MPAPASSYKTLRRQLDDLGYYQPLVPEAVPLVEALLHDLLATTHNLKICQEQGRKSRETEHPESDHTGSKKEASAKDKKKDDNNLAADVRVIKLQSKVSDLELLNKECMDVIKNLQGEIEERNKKILKLELSQKAKILTQHDRPHSPRMEMTSLVTQSKQKDKEEHIYDEPERIDVVSIYEARNKDLEQDLVHLQAELDKAKQMLANVEKYWSQQMSDQDGNQAEQPFDLNDETSSQKSAYVVKLLEENKELRNRLESLEKAGDSCFHGKTLYPGSQVTLGQHGHHHHHQHHQDVRSEIEHSHAQFQNAQYGRSHAHQLYTTTGQKQHPRPSSAHSGPSYSEKLAQKNSHHMKQQHNHIHILQEELREALEQNRELNRRVNELTKIKKNLKDKIDQMEGQADILMANTNGKKVKELITYMERQRSIYKNNVEQLLDKLDPDRRTLEEQLNKNNTELNFIAGVSGHVSSKEIMRPETGSEPRVKVVKTGLRASEKEVQQQQRMSQHYPSYSPSAYKSTSNYSASTTGVDNVQDLHEKLAQLNREKMDIEAKLLSENQILAEKVSKMKERVSLLEEELQEAKRISSQTVGNIREESEDRSSKYHRDISAFQKQIRDLREELSRKESQVRSLISDKDLLHQQLDDKAVRIDELRKRLVDIETSKNQAETDKNSQDVRVNQCLIEIQTLQSRLSEEESSLAAMKAKVDAEKEVARELRIENNTLKEELTALKSSSDTKQSQIEDLRAHIQRYINEVKRIEELLALRERERSELLEQYKCLTDEAETAAKNGRRMETKVSSLQMELQAKEQELEASQTRLSNMEKDLIELTASNENYRSTMANLSTRVDIAESELRIIRNHETWATQDLTDVQQLTEQLNAQKAELQTQLAQQAKEIEDLQGEIRNLKSELAHLTTVFERERSRNVDLERELTDARNGKEPRNR